MSRARPTPLPGDRHYDPVHHLWARRDSATGRVRVGIDAIGLESLGELAYVALPATGAVLVRGQSLGSLEAAKMTTTIAAPIGGRVVARNDAVVADPLRVNQDPYDHGWLVELEPTAWSEDAVRLVHGEAIAAWAAAEWQRLAADEPAGEADHGG